MAVTGRSETPSPHIKGAMKVMHAYREECIWRVRFARFVSGFWCLEGLDIETMHDGAV